MGLGHKGELLELRNKCVRASGVLGAPWWGEAERGWKLKKGLEQEGPSGDTFTVTIGLCSITHRAGPGKGLLDVCLKVDKAVFSLWTWVQASGFLFGLYADMYL